MRGILTPVYWITRAGWKSSVHLVGYPYRAEGPALCGTAIGGRDARSVVWPIGPDIPATDTTCSTCRRKAGEAGR